MEVTFWMEDVSPKRRYALEFLLTSAGYRPKQTRDAASATIYYGQNREANLVVIPRRDVDGENPPESVEAPKIGSPFAHDIVAACEALLTDDVNAGASGLDAFGRLPFRASFQARNGAKHARPLVNVYVKAMQDCLCKAVGKGTPMWPHGKSSVIGLSHDVDRLDQWAAISNVWRGDFLAGVRALAKLMLDRDDDFGLALDLGEKERSYGFKSTFFFAAVSRFESGEVLDVNYSVGGSRMRKVMRRLAEQGHEIGLHASFNAYRSAAQFRREKERIEEASGRPVHGLRHHFWHLGEDVGRTLRHHESAEFMYDTSVAFNEDAGFRRSTALPFYPWDAEENRPIRVLQLPVCVMDGNYFYRSQMTAKDCVDEMMPVLDEIDRWGGIGVIDWHSDTSHPGTKRYSEWGKAYFELLERLSETPSRWVTSLEEITAWVQKREDEMGFWPARRAAHSMLA